MLAEKDYKWRHSDVSVRPAGTEATPERKVSGRMRVIQAFDISNDLDGIPRSNYNRLESNRGGVGDMSKTGQWIGRDLDRALLYGVIASLLLHMAAFFLVPIILENKISSGPPVVNQERVTPVRLVEHPLSADKEPVPPDKPAAISDRNHTAEKQRVPKSLSAKKQGPAQPPRKQVAALPKKPAQEKPKKKPNPEKQSKKPEDKSKKRDQKEPKRIPDEMLKDLSMLAPGALGAAFPMGRRQAALDKKSFDPRLPPEVLFPSQNQMEQSPGLYPEGSPDEPVLDLNTKNDKYFNYLLHLKRKIEAVWVYPRVAAKSGIGGQLTVEFVIGRDGNLKMARLLDSSGHDILDRAALKALEDGSPFNPFPGRFKAKRLRIRANFVYVTQRLFHKVL